MKLKHYMQKLQKLIIDNPQCEDMDIVFSVDHEGSEYDVVLTEPVMGVYTHSKFKSISLMSSTDRLESDINAVCIN
jgi:hypothetical protein